MFHSLITAACAILKPARVPMQKIEYASGEARPPVLIVFLPGRTSGPADFEKQGFVRAVRERRIAADMVSANAHMGYYYNWTFVPRLHEDVILPARRAGYEQIWIVGISAGGIGALNYARHHPEMVSGLYVMAPFLGETAFIESVRRAGGLARWEPPTAIAPRDYQNATWAWLKGYASTPAARPPLAIGIGMKDRFAAANHLLADVLPADRVYLTDGGHDWPAWKALWAKFLDAQTFWPTLAR
jgi:pimeloyl-ACP methyl ester carboxylesterase